MTMVEAVDMTSHAVNKCPAEDMRKMNRDMHIPDSIFSIDEDGVWHITGFEEVRQVLKSQNMVQDGFSSDDIGRSKAILKNLPILYQDGEIHHRMRRETNRFFTPAVTSRDYHDFMETFADKLIATLQEKKQMDVSDLSMEMAVKVASKIVGLTNSVMPGLKGRLVSLVEVAEKMLHNDSLQTFDLIKTIRSQWNLGSFYLLDVKPSIQKRRKNSQEDVISYLLDLEYTDLDILTECLVYAVAGMVTTREFICVALWHLLENPHLAERMRVGEEKERYAILHEILRLEPVVSKLYRKPTTDITIQSNGEDVTIPAGTRIALYIIEANVDERVMGENSHAVCPMREKENVRPRPQDMGLSFGDGAHRCPGAFVAIQESDIFLRKLLALPGLRLEEQPEPGYMHVIEGYELRNFIVHVD